MPDLKLTFDPTKVKITDDEILADLAYPARAPSRRRERRATRRPSRRR
jgi:hypothetical protein